MSDRPTILHVSESFGGGVAQAILDYAHSVPEFHHVVLASNPRGNPRGLLDDSRVKIFEAPRSASPWTWVRRIRQNMQEIEPVLVHAHSSFAGAYVRLAAPRGARVVYTPHGFSFERRDVHSVIRLAWYAAEMLLSVRAFTLAACSAREAELGRALSLRRNRSVYVPNTCHLGSIRLSEPTSGPSRVVMCGRLTPAKDPQFFAEAARYAQSRFGRSAWHWIGDGDDAEKSVLLAAGVTISGWQDHAKSLEEIARAAVYVHTAKWEGSPLTVIEAAALGKPIVVREIGAFAGQPIAQIRTPQELAEVVEAILTNREVERRAREDARTYWRAHSPERQAEALRSVYTRPATTSDPSVACFSPLRRT